MILRTAKLSHCKTVVYLEAHLSETTYIETHSEVAVIGNKIETFLGKYTAPLVEMLRGNDQTKSNIQEKQIITQATPENTSTE